MGVSLPVVVYLGNWLIFTHHVGACLLPSSKVPYSLSAYYYTHMRGIFTGTFWALGVFLVAYNGHDRCDQVITTIAGLAAIGIGTFPTAPPTSYLAAQAGVCGPVTPVAYLSSVRSQTSIGYLHVASLILLMAMLFVMALRFTKTSPDEQARKSDQEKKQKQRNNRIYRTSAAAIAVGAAGAIVQNFLSVPVKAQTPWLFWFEIVAIFAFGVAWFVKGDALSPPVNFVRRTIPFFKTHPPRPAHAEAG
jgi:hypothetical protein